VPPITISQSTAMLSAWLFRKPHTEASERRPAALLNSQAAGRRFHWRRRWHMGIRGPSYRWRGPSRRWEDAVLVIAVTLLLLIVASFFYG
jgi:hypothetical protein